ncbi:sperm flagellar protein 1-like [Pollicipes pollicipes]|uniref:sperm flagellar protein 1-like n=1 Tax=Pollicipes pollicipes TaxID=41117 RepID=UPI001884DF8B|nr:sperm flagellar protein 1-like [Pollicipes pollicipes]
MFAEVVQYFVPRLIELHNYIPANSVKQKRQNWDLLWRKVLPKFSIKTSDINTEWVVQAKPGAIEKLLYLLKTKLDESSADGRDLDDSNSNSVQQAVTPPTSDRQPSPALSDASPQRADGEPPPGKDGGASEWSTGTNPLSSNGTAQSGNVTEQPGNVTVAPRWRDGDSWYSDSSESVESADESENRRSKWRRRKRGSSSSDSSD